MIAIFCSFSFFVSLLCFAQYLSVFKWILIDAGILLVSLICCGRLAKYPAAFLLMCLAFFFFNELFVRLIYFGPAGLDFVRFNTAIVGSPPTDPEFDDSSFTHLKPGSLMKIRGMEYRINNFGFRGPTLNLEKDAAKFRILLIGTCSGEGLGVEYADSYPVRLEQELKEKFSNLELLNLSVDGAYTGNMLYYLRELGDKFHPDLILFDRTLWNPLPPIAQRFLLGPRLFKKGTWGIEERLGATSFFQTQLELLRRELVHPLTVNFKYLKPFLPVLANFGRPFSDDDLKADTVWTVKSVKQIAPSAPLVFFILPPMNNEWSADGMLKERDAFKKLAGDNQFPVLDIYFAPHDQALLQYRCLPGDPHPNAKAHLVFAREMARQLRPIILALKKQKGLE
ncbi:MAG: hypothetical protein K2X27_20680 [Candidatus Obscuribacterales bacterium]|nr:hypothetical protein [Candidatus Obscuribacterales bacterium]